MAKRGFQHTIEDCEPPTTTTTEPPTTTTTEPPTTTTTTTTQPIPPPISGNNVEPPAPAPAAPVAPVATVTATPPLTQLPFTGRDIKPFLFGGLTLVALGLALVAPPEVWRRLSRRLSRMFPATSRWLSGTRVGRASLALRLRGAPSVVGCTFFGL